MLCGRGVGRDEAVKSITDQLDCKCTEEDEFDDVEDQPKDEFFHIVHGLHDLVVVRHRQSNVRMRCLWIDLTGDNRDRKQVRYRNCAPGTCRRVR